MAALISASTGYPVLRRIPAWVSRSRFGARSNAGLSAATEMCLLLGLS